MRTRASFVRWGATVGACVAALLVVVLASSASSPDGRRGAVVFGIVGLVLLVAGLVIGSGVYPAGLVAVGVSFAFSLAGNQVGSVQVVVAAALMLLVDQLASWSFDAATGAVERGRTITTRCVRVLVIVAAGAGVSALVLSAGDLPVPGGFAAEVIGIAAALAVLGLAASRRWER